MQSWQAVGIPVMDFEEPRMDKMPTDFDLEPTVTKYLSKSLVFFPTVSALIKSVSVMNDDPIRALEIMLCGILLNIILAMGFVAIYRIYKLIK